MRVLCLTGSIGMGKSTAANTFRRLRVPVFDADAAVHRLQAPGGRAVAPIAAAFPGTVRDTPRGPRVDREALRRAVLGDDAALNRLERIVHPLVRDAEQRFLGAARRRAEPLVVLDIPLLFETRGAGALRRGAGGDGPRRRAAPPRAAPSGHDGGAPRVPSWRGRCPIRRSAAAPTTSSTPACRASTRSAPSGPSSGDTGRRHDAADRARHRDHRPRPGDRRPRHRDRGDRTRQPGADGARLAHPARPRARRAGGKHARPRLHRGDAARQAEIRGEGRGDAALPRRRADHRAQRALRFRLPRRRAACARGGGGSTARAWSTAWRSPRSAFSACRTAWTRCAGASASTTPCAPATTRCSTCGCWRRSTWS